MQKSLKESIMYRMNCRNKRIAACKLEKLRFLSVFGKPPSKSFLLNIPTTGQGLKTTQSVLHLTRTTDTQEYREHSLNTFHPVTPKKKEY